MTSQNLCGALKEVQMEIYSSTSLLKETRKKKANKQAKLTLKATRKGNTTTTTQSQQKERNCKDQSRNK